MYSSSPPTLHEPGHLITPQGQQTPHYRIVRLLGTGGMGQTYEAQVLPASPLPSPHSRTPHLQNSRTPQHVALKALSLRQMTDWKSLDLFEREAKVLANLNHPGIPRYLDSFCVDVPSMAGSLAQSEPNRTFYLVREFIPGESLWDAIAHGWRPKETDLKAIALQVLRILDYLHTLSPPLIHRDIKPQNLIRHPDGNISLVDFGSVQEIYRHTFLGSNTFVGTAGYMPPEQFRGQVSPASDLYALGATLLYLAIHKTPDQLPQSRMKIDLTAHTHFSGPFITWLDKLLEPMEEDRFQQAKAAALALKQPGRLLSQKNPTAVVVTPQVTDANVLPAISRPANARSVVERSPHSLSITIPIPEKPNQQVPTIPKEPTHKKSPIIARKLWHVYITKDGKLLNQEGAAIEGTRFSLFLQSIIVLTITVALLSILFMNGWGVLDGILAIFILGVFIRKIKLLTKGFQIELRKEFRNPFAASGYQGHADTINLCLKKSYFSMEYKYLGNCEYLIRDATPNFQISLEPYNAEAPDSSEMICSSSEKPHQHRRKQKDYRFGHGLTLAEQEWLVEEISAFLKAIQ